MAATRQRLAALPVIVVVMAVTGCAPSPAPDDAEAGESIFERRCVACHGPDGGGTEAGPSLESVTVERIRAAVTEGVDERPDYPAMPAVPLTSAQLEAVIVHLDQIGAVTPQG